MSMKVDMEHLNYGEFADAYAKGEYKIQGIKIVPEEMKEFFK